MSYLSSTITLDVFQSWTYILESHVKVRENESSVVQRSMGHWGFDKIAFLNYSSTYFPLSITDSCKSMKGFRDWYCNVSRYQKSRDAVKRSIFCLSIHCLNKLRIRYSHMKTKHFEIPWRIKSLQISSIFSSFLQQHTCKEKVFVINFTHIFLKSSSQQKLLVGLARVRYLSKKSTELFFHKIIIVLGSFCSISTNTLW